ncbi:excinuclease ABC subunit UvrC [soil metagenome]
MTSQELLKIELPDAPGVYFFRNDKDEILYIGKATSLRDRARSYFGKDLIKTRGIRLVQMIDLARTITFVETQSVLEALMLETSQIKKHLPIYNTSEKDNKSFNMIVLTDEDYPQLLVFRSRNLVHWSTLSKGMKILESFGPFPHGGELREALKIIRKIFPYRDNKCTPWNEQKDPLNPRQCFNYQIGLCPGVCVNAISKREYRKDIKHLRLFLRGEKVELIKDLEKEMGVYAKLQKFEEAQSIKRVLYSLDHIQDVALIKHDAGRIYDEDVFRIEAYDIAHISGSDTVGVMVVIEDDELAKSQYRKFKIRGSGGRVKVDDTNNLKEVLERRLTHLEWQFPNLMVIDGGVGQINAAKEIIEKNSLNIEIVSVVKDTRHKPKGFLGNQELIDKWNKSILLANSEAHRFAITYHRKLRTKGFRM